MDAYTLFFKLFLVGYFLLILLVSIYALLNIYIIVAYRNILLTSRYSNVAIILFAAIFTMFVLLPITLLDLGKMPKTLAYLTMATIEICLYYLIATSISPSSLQKKILATISCSVILLMIIHSQSNSSGSNDEMLFLVISIAYTYSSLKYFMKIASNIDSMLRTEESEIYLQLALFLCNSLPMIASLCQMGIRIAYPEFDSRLFKQESQVLFKASILHYFILLGYLLFFFYTAKSFKCLTKTYISK